MISVDVACGVVACVRGGHCLSRPGETNRGSPKLLCTNYHPGFCVQTVAQATGFHFERGMISLGREWTRLSENPQ